MLATGIRVLGAGAMHRCVIRLSVFLLSLTILTVFAPNNAQAQMCVRYARMLTNFTIHGDAWTWWDGAVGRYQRGIRPMTGSVLVFRRTGHLHQGHVSVVSRVIDRRTVLVDHSWLEGDVLHRGMRVVDTSPNNSWSSVRVWNDPSDTLGQRTYPTFGFVYPRGGRQDGLDAPLTMASADAGTDRTEDGDGGAAAGRTPRTRTAALARVSPAASRMLLLQRKPGVVLARAETPVSGRGNTGGGSVVASLPSHKPRVGTAQGSARIIEVSQVPEGTTPRHKPGSHGAHQGHATQVAELHARGGASENND